MHPTMSLHEESVVAMAWYRPDQWALLRAVSADGERLEGSYEEWLAFASEELRELQARGLQVRRIDVEVAALVRWCNSQGRLVDGEARAEYALRGLGQEL
jgi:hypothetical protein